jgi:hypothetical protein
MRVSAGLAVLVVGLLILALEQHPEAQGGNALVGAWERVLATKPGGAPNPEPVAFLIFSASGHFSQTAVPSGRPKLSKSLEDMTREELLANFRGVQVRYGTYTVNGNKLTRRDVTHVNPNQEGSEAVQEFRLEGELLILTSTDPKSKAQATFRRVK